MNFGYKNLYIDYIKTLKLIIKKFSESAIKVFKKFCFGQTSVDRDNRKVGILYFLRLFADTFRFLVDF